MRVEVLYVLDCPHHPTAIKQLRAVLLAEGIASEIIEVLVKDAMTAEELGFRGSPTIRINGRDIAGESHSTQSGALACRVYPGSNVVGVPPLELMQRAVREALKEERG